MTIQMTDIKMESSNSRVRIPKTPPTAPQTAEFLGWLWGDPGVVTSVIKVGTTFGSVVAVVHETKSVPVTVPEKRKIVENN